MAWYDDFDRWLYRDDLPNLDDGEVVRFDIVVGVPTHRWWQSVAGRLVLTDRRLVFVSRVPRPASKRIFGLPEFDVARTLIASSSVRKSWKTHLAVGFGPWIATVEFTDGTKRTFSCWRARELCEQLERT